jgi:hypothetical protein
MKKLHRSFLAIIPCLLCLMTLPGQGVMKPSNDSSSSNAVDGDAELLFLPTYAVPGGRPGLWKLGIHAWVYEPEKDSIKRKLLVDMARKDLGLKERDAASRNFESMAAYLLVDQEGSMNISVTVGGTDYGIGKTNKNGHAESEIIIEEKALGPSMVRRNGSRYIMFYADTSSQPKRRFYGKARIIEKGEVFVVSDIDDTIRITGVRDRAMLIENTFFRPFVPVPGMAAIYATMARNGAVVNYVSAGPWQLYPPLAEFLRREGFPDGLFRMRYFGFSKNLSALFESSESVKKPFIEGLMKQFPGHRFIFFGDSGEQDPELYGECARMSPGQVAGIYIRNVTDESIDSPRMVKAFRDLPAGLWRLFKDIREYNGEIIRRTINR